VKELNRTTMSYIVKFLKAIWWVLTSPFRVIFSKKTEQAVEPPASEAVIEVQKVEEGDTVLENPLGETILIKGKKN
jgi:hypothetical protein